MPPDTLHPSDRIKTALPNTLCHIALQTPLNRWFCRGRELIWVIMACIVPDIPWILLRVLLPLRIFDPFDLRLFTAIQASLMFCLILSAALAQLARAPGRIFLILGLNCLFHLLLDATQIKWGNGVHLFSPFDWSALQWHIFRPEHPLGIFITVFGFIYLLWIWPKMHQHKPHRPVLTASRLLILLGCLLFYLTAPLLFMWELEKTGYYSLHILRDVQGRTGKQVEFDRVPYSGTAKTITTFSGEQIRLTGNRPVESGLISLQGRFLSATTVRTDRYRRHDKIRDWASLIGLFLACTFMAQTYILPRLPFNRPLKGQTS